MMLKAKYPLATTINISTKAGCYTFQRSDLLEGNFGFEMFKTPNNPALRRRFVVGWFGLNEYCKTNTRSQKVMMDV